jgi:hypothetical protein
MGMAELLGEQLLVVWNRRERGAQARLLGKAPRRLILRLHRRLRLDRRLILRRGIEFEARIAAAELVGYGRHFIADRREIEAAPDLVAGQRKVMVRIAEKLDRSAVTLVLELELGCEVYKRTSTKNAKPLA